MKFKITLHLIPSYIVTKLGSGFGGN